MFSDGFVLLWKKGKDIVAVGSQLIDKADTRVKLEETDNGNTLVISLAEPSDAGEYSCQLSATNMLELRHSVRIRGKIFIYSKNFERKMMVILETNNVYLPIDQFIDSAVSTHVQIYQLTHHKRGEN